MATAPSPAPGSDAHASFVGKLVADPKQPPNTLLLTGFLGASSDDGHTRLYFDAQLSDYVEIPDDAILHRQDMPAGLSPLGASYVWVRRDATLIHGPIGPDRLKASFLEGRVARDHAAAAAVPHLPPVTAPIICDITDLPPRCHPTTLPVCRPTQPPACPAVTSVAAGCPAPTTPAAGCPAPTTPAAGCPVATSPAICQPVTAVAAHCVPYTHIGPNCRATVNVAFCHTELAACRPTHAEPCQPTEYIHCPTGYGACPLPADAAQARAAANAVAPQGVTLGAPACFMTHVACPAPTQAGPLCVATVFAPVCHPTLSGPACGVTHIGCPPVTLPPHCLPPTLAGPNCPVTHLVCPPVTHVVCPPVTLPPHCVPHTLAGPGCPVTHLLCPPVTQPPHCVPQTIYSPACGHTVFGPACGGVTAVAVCQLTHGGPACVPATGLPGCAPSLAGCPSGIACNPGTIVNPGLPGAVG